MIVKMIHDLRKGMQKMKKKKMFTKYLEDLKEQTSREEKYTRRNQ